MTSPSATARPRVVIVGGEFTVSVAPLLVVLPALLVTTTVNTEPLSPLTVAGVV